MPELRETHEVFTCLGEAEIIPPKWLIKDLLPPGLVFIGAPPKAGKSTFEMILTLLVSGHQCAALPPYLSVVEQSGTVIGFSYEATAGELRHMCEEGLGTMVKDDKSILIADDPWLFRLDDVDGAARLMGWLEERKPKMCFLDPLRDFHSLDEKDSGDMIRLLRPLQRWAKDHDSALVVVHHTKKKEEGDYTPNDLRGSSAIFGAADAVIIMTPKPDGMTTISATFKRAASWERTIRIASYGAAAMQPEEGLDDVARDVLKLLRGGATSQDGIAKQLKLRRQRVTEAIALLEQVGLLTRDAAGKVQLP